MRRLNRLYLPTFVIVVASAAAAVVVGCASDTDPSLNPQPLPPNHEPDGKKDENEPSGSFGNNDGKGEDGTPSGGEAAEPPPATPGATDAGDGQ